MGGDTGTYSNATEEYGSGAGSYEELFTATSGL
jgi:hypothetical protein